MCYPTSPKSRRATHTNALSVVIQILILIIICLPYPQQQHQLHQSLLKPPPTKLHHAALSHAPLAPVRIYVGRPPNDGRRSFTSASCHICNRWKRRTAKRAVTFAAAFAYTSRSAMKARPPINQYSRLSCLARTNTSSTRTRKKGVRPKAIVSLSDAERVRAKKTAIIITIATTPSLESHQEQADSKNSPVDSSDGIADSDNPSLASHQEESCWKKLLGLSRHANLSVFSR